MSWILLSSRGLELDQRFSGHPSAMFHFDALRLGPPADCRAVCPVAGVLGAPGLVARHRLGPSCRASVSRSARGMPGVQSDVLLGALQPGADGIAFDAATGSLYVANGGEDAGHAYSMISIIDTVREAAIGDIRVEASALHRHRAQHAEVDFLFKGRSRPRRRRRHRG